MQVPTSPPDTDPEPSPGGRPRLPRRLFSRAVVGLLVSVAGLDVALWIFGALPGRSFVFLGIGAAMGLSACLAWEVVERKESHGTGYGPLAWIAFPAAFLLGFGQMPFLALSVYPDLGRFLEQHGRVEAYWESAPEGRRLTIDFPRRVEQGPRAGNNLRFDATPVPSEYYRSHGDYFRWVRPRTLSIDIEAVKRDLELEEVIWVGVNTDLNTLRSDGGSWPYRYADGGRVPAQRIRVR